MKKCLKCLLNKEFISFNKSNRNKDGLQSYCKECYRLMRSDSYKKYKIREDEYHKNYKKENPNKIKEYKRNYFLKNKDIKMNDPLYKLTLNLRRRLNHSLKTKKWYKNSHFNNYIGCTLDILKNHIEKQFEFNMSWNNWSKTGWHIDHIVPLSSAKTEQELYKLCHYTNLQPLWAVDNLKKHNKIMGNVK